MTNFTFDSDDIYRNETIQGYDIHNEHLNYKKMVLWWQIWEYKMQQWSCNKVNKSF